jgi:plastocyanin
MKPYMLQNPVEEIARASLNFYQHVFYQYALKEANMTFKKLGRLAILPTFAIVITFAQQFAQAASLSLEFVDESGEPVANAVAALMPTDKPSSEQKGKGIIDQRNNAFVPDVLAIRVNTQVYFPNSDNVRHQVYSFSPAKRFELRLYHGLTAEPILFDQPGLVILGCNIHDSMVGYIYVLDTDHFGLSDIKGQLAINSIPAGTYKLQIQHPKLDIPHADQQLILSVEKTYTQKVKLIGLTKKNKESPDSLNNLFK